MEVTENDGGFPIKTVLSRGKERIEKFDKFGENKRKKEFEKLEARCLRLKSLFFMSSPPLPDGSRT